MAEMYLEVGGRCGQYFTRNMVYPFEKREDAFRDIQNKTGGKDAYYCTYLFDKKDRKGGTKYYGSIIFPVG